MELDTKFFRYYTFKKYFPPDRSPLYIIESGRYLFPGTCNSQNNLIQIFPG